MGQTAPLEDVVEPTVVPVQAQARASIFDASCGRLNILTTSYYQLGSSIDATRVIPGIHSALLIGN